MYSVEPVSSSKGDRNEHTNAELKYLLTNEDITFYHDNGYLFKRNLFSTAEMDALFSTIKNDSYINNKSHTRKDKGGFLSRLSLWNHPGVNMYGAVARSARIVDNVETLLSGCSHRASSSNNEKDREEAYHYHTKVMMKEKLVGGAWEWHQDYGYWYNNGCMYPQMISVMLAIDAHSIENGCLRVLSKSHLMGRINHTLVGEQAGADMSRVEIALNRFSQIPVECSPGDVFFLHCNTLHASSQNKSDRPRWSMICCYNTRNNNPYKFHHHPCYTPLDRWSDKSVMDLANVGITDNDGTIFMNHAEDHSAKVTITQQQS